MSTIPTAVIITHSTEVFGPPNALADYLRKRQATLLYIDHPLDFNPARRTTVTLWHGQRKVFEKHYPNWLGIGVVNYAKDFFITLWVLGSHKEAKHVQHIIGFDSLSCLPALLIRWLLRPDQIIAYNADYSTTRFHQPILNALYLAVDRYVMARVHKIWCVTERISKIRRKDRKRASDVLTVPNGVNLSAVARKGSHDQGLVFIGNLTPEKGIDTLIRALAEVDTIKLTVYGDGPYRSLLEELTVELGLKNRVIFAGKRSNKEILELLPCYQAGVALYRDSESYVYYSDPLKVKEYLAAGLPVILSAVPEIAGVVATAGAGVMIEQEDQLPTAIKKVFTSYRSMSRAATDLAKLYDWDILFNQAFEQGAANDRKRE